ncbi:hypothetical protein GCM10028807_18530 [Spirosoma daeguense]
MNKPLQSSFEIVFVLLLALFSGIVRGQAVSLTTLGSAYTQNFDTMSNTDGSTTNNLTITGWFMTESGGGARDNEQYAVGTGSSNFGDTYSFGASGSTERALGGLRSGTLIPIFGAAFTNNTGATINSLQIAYNGEQWRLGTETAGRIDRLNFEYSTNATDLNTGTWAPIADLDFVASVTAGVGAKNGNDAANRIALSTTINNQSIANGATFWIRWTDVDASGADDGLAVDDFSLTPQGIVSPNLSINDVSLNEGNAGTTSFNFTVSLSAPAPAGGVTFDIATANGTAIAPGDYTAKSLTSQTIPAGSSTYTFTVLVNGETSVEPNETFFVNVTNVTNAVVTDGQGQGTIVNDDAAPNLTINDVTLIEGNAGTTNFNFTVSLSAPAPAGGVTFDIATANGTATAPGDYIANSLTSQTIPAGSSVYTFSVLVNGDTSVEPDETFFVNVTNVTNAVVTDGQGQGTILNDDAAPNLTINDVSLNEGNSGTTTFNFTASLSAPAPAGGVTFNILTADGTAIAPGDYTSAAGTVTIPQGVSTGNFAVLVNGDTSVEPDETFFVNVTNVTNAVVTDGQGQGTIVNDDVAPVMSATLAGSSTICAGQSATLTATITNGASPYEVTISDGTSTSVISGYVSGAAIVVSPGATTTYTISALMDANGRSASSGNLSGNAVVTIDAVTASLSPSGSTITCSNPSVSLTATGGTSYTLSNGESNNTGLFTVNSPGTYTVVVTNASGCTASATAFVGSNNSPLQATLEADGSLSCASSSVTLFAMPAEQYRYEFSAGVIQMGNGNMAAVTEAGTYSVIITASNGCTATASVTVAYEDYTPMISVTPQSATLTCSEPTVTLEALVEGPIVWSTGETTQMISVTAAGVYSVTISDGGSCTASASAEVFQDNSIATVSINPTSATLNCGNPSTTLTAVGMGTYRWSTGETTQAISATSAGTYSVTLTTGNACTAVASAEVFQDNTPPALSINPQSATLTCTNPSATLTANGNGTYVWSTGAISQTISVTSATIYSVTLTAANGCTATATTEIFQNNTPPSISINPQSATLNCTTASVSLSAIGAGTYLWSTGEKTQTINVASGGTYSVTLTTGNGCTAVASAGVVQDNSAATVSINPTNTTLTCSNPSATLAAVGSGAYRWSTGETTQTISVSSGGTYSVTLTAGNGCTGTASVTITQNNSAPSVSISPSIGTPTGATLNCGNSSITLTAVGTGTYLWNTGAISQTINVTSAGTYSVVLTGTNGCTATASLQVVQDNSGATVSINPTSATLSCSNPSVVLSAVGQGSYLWNTGVTSSSISVSSGGTYSVTLTAGNGCKATASVEISQDNSVPSVNISATPSLTIGSGESTTLTASGATTYLWSTGVTSSFIVVNAAGIYSVTGTTGNCKAQASATVIQANVPSGPFAITAVTTNACTQISNNRYVISFTPQYGGLNGQPVSLSVVNEMFPTTAPGPHTLQLYNDNPIIVLKAQQGGSSQEASYTYNWLANCRSPQPNTPPRVNQPLTDQVAKVGQEFGYTIPQTTFTDNESPHTLVLSVAGLPAGLSFSPPTQIGGVPSMTGVSTVTVTATDPQGLSVSASFVLTVVEPSATNTPPVLVNPIANQVAIQEQPFGLNVANTFTDAQTPNALTLTASGLPTGLNLVGTTITGTPALSGTSTVTLMATDPGGLTASTQFGLTVQPASSTIVTSFAITGVSPVACTQISHNRYEIGFQLQYSGLNGQPVSVSVVNEMFPTTAPGPYSLQLYNDNPTIIVKATQQGSAGESSFTYNWLANCQSPQTNTPPRVNQPLTDQVAKVGQEFGYTIPQTTFTDNESPHTLVLSVAGLPAGLSFSPPTQIGGVPSMTGVSTVTVTATDPQGLSVSASFVLTVNPANAPNPGQFSITGVQTISCEIINAGLKLVRFQPQYSNVNGQPIRFSVVNELLPTTASGPYTLQLYTDNPVITVKATQEGTPGEASFSYNWLAGCSNPAGREGLSDQPTLEVVVLGNPVIDEYLDLELRNGQGQSVNLTVVNEQGRSVSQLSKLLPTNTERLRLPLGKHVGVYLLQITSPGHRQTIKLLKQ